MKPCAARILQMSIAVALAQARDRDRGPFSRDASLARADAPSREQMAAGTWSPVASMPTARFGLAVTTGKHGIIYAIGGSTGLAGPIVPAVEAYDQKTGSWSALAPRSEEHTSELQSQSNLVCRLLLEKKKKK